MVIMGLIYIFNPYNLTSDAAPTTAFWGKIAVLAGIIALLAVKGLKRNLRLRKLILSIDLMAIILLQLPPVFLWFVFNGTIVSDGPGGPHGRWFWSIPHIIVTGAVAYSLYHLFFRDPT